MNAATEGGPRRCSVLVLAAAAERVPQLRVLEDLGFHVDHANELPEGDGLERYHAVLLVLATLDRAAMVAARIRARRRFGRRVMIALVPEHLPESERRAVVPAGFDDVLGVTTPGRTIAARILRRLRDRPEHRCVLLRHPGSSSAA